MFYGHLLLSYLSSLSTWLFEAAQYLSILCLTLHSSLVCILSILHVHWNLLQILCFCTPVEFIVTTVCPIVVWKKSLCDKIQSSFFSLVHKQAFSQFTLSFCHFFKSLISLKAFIICFWYPSKPLHYDTRMVHYSNLYVLLFFYV